MKDIKRAIQMLSRQGWLIVLLVAVFVSFGLNGFAAETNDGRVLYTSYKEMLHSVFQSGVANEKGFEISFETNQLSFLQPNFLTNLLSEIQSQLFRTLVADDLPDGELPKKIFQFKIFACLENEGFVWLDFRSGTNDSSPDDFQQFRRRVEFYVKSRCQGHTKDYVVAAIQEAKGTNHALPTGFPVSLKNKYWIPSKWIPNPSGDVFHSLNYWVVIDGRFAWVYDASGFPQKRDAQEYDPKLAPKFAMAKEEALHLLDTRGIHEIDSSYLLNVEIQRILKQRFKIEWLTPEELKVSEFF